MKKGRKGPRLDKETKSFIKRILRSGVKADKLEAKSDKLEARTQKKIEDLREQAAGIRAGIKALKEAVKTV